MNALNAASKYLSPGARVVVVDRGARWGGQWCEQYDYVRLHQPYEQFTAGERTWAIASGKPPGHLASKMEILSHFEDVVQACVAETGIELVTLFRYEHGEGSSDYRVVGGRVQLTVEPLTATSELPPVTIVADRMIRAGGFDVKVNGSSTECCPPPS